MVYDDDTSDPLHNTIRVGDVPRIRRQPRPRIDPLADARRRAEASHLSPTLLAALILVGLAAALAVITKLLFDDPTDQILDFAGLLAMMAAFGLIGIFAGAAYVAMTGGQHPDVGLERLWRRHRPRRRRSSTTNAAVE